MSSRADRPEVTAATRKKSLALKKPVMSAITARHDPTYYQQESSYHVRTTSEAESSTKRRVIGVKREDIQR